MLSSGWQLVRTRSIFLIIHSTVLSKKWVCKSFTDLKSILFPLSLFARCLFPWCVEMHVWKSNAIQRHICLSWSTSFLFLLPTRKSMRILWIQGQLWEVFYCAWLCSLLLGKQAFYCYRAGRWRGWSWCGIKILGNDSFVWIPGQLLPLGCSLCGGSFSGGVTSEIGVLRSCDYLSLALSPCQ